MIDSSPCSGLEVEIMEYQHYLAWFIVAGAVLYLLSGVVRGKPKPRCGGGGCDCASRSESRRTEELIAPESLRRKK
jgi:hypothetical protein